VQSFLRNKSIRAVPELDKDVMQDIVGLTFFVQDA
jgi:hypothetical protein